MQSLDWVDRTYTAKHATEDPTTLRALYYPTLATYHPTSTDKKQNPIKLFLFRYFRRAGLSLLIYSLSFAPTIGRFVLPAASFYSFNTAVGTTPAAVVFGVGIFLPRRWMVVFLQGYFASRGLMRELLQPYFSRIKFSAAQRQRWFRDREGLLFGFGFGFYLLIKVPLLGVLIYGIAEASTAVCSSLSLSLCGGRRATLAFFFSLTEKIKQYLITKITDPVPPADQFTPEFAESQVVWRNKHEFMKLELSALDKLNVKSLKKSEIASPLDLGGAVDE